MEVLFWILIALVVYTYVGYGLVLRLLLVLKRLFKPRKYDFSERFEPAVTLAIPAYNEEDFILKKAKNSLALDYPKDKLRILFITDGSTDNTVRLLQEVDGIEVIHEDRRAGKSAAENRVMQFIDSPIVVFCDANTLLNKEAIRELVKYYVDPKVGGVSGEKRILQSSVEGATGAGEGLYWKYESTLKKWDAELYSIVGAAGELVSFRTTLVMTLEEDTILDDFMQSLRICEKGYRMEYEPEAYAMETSSANVKEELKRKVRIAAGGWQSMYRLRHLLNPFRNPLLWFQYVSHRVLRWSISALALPVILVLNLLLAFQETGLGTYSYLLVAQVAFYVFAGIGWILENRKIRVKILFVPYYFLMMNYAVFAGFFRYVKRSQDAAWERSRRAADPLDFGDD